MKYICHPYQYSLPASALFYALIIAVLMATFSTAIISLFFQNRIFTNQIDLQKKLNRNANAALNLLKGTEQEVSTAFQDLYGKGTDSVWLSKFRWGLHEVVAVQAFQHTPGGKEQCSKVLFLGSRPKSGIQTAALYLEDNSMPLSLVGNTHIVGTAYLPLAGVKSGNVNGKTFYGDELISGAQKTSSKNLPLIDGNAIEHLKNLSGKTNTHSQQSLPDSVRHSFFEEPLFYRSAVIHIQNQILKGNICLIADSLIYFSRDAIVEDILVIAPKIYFEEEFEGNLQAFASQKLEIGNGIHLHYPSIAGIIQPESSEILSVLKIASNSIIEGLVISMDESLAKPIPLINIQKNSLIIGQVYSSGNLDLKAEVHGNVITAKFKLQTPSSNYDNHLLDVAIRYDERSEFFIPPSFLEGKGAPAIVKWLY